MNAAEEVAKLQAMFSGAEALADGAHTFVFLPRLQILSGQLLERDALLCPHAHSGYRTRLFLSAPIPRKGANWTRHVLFTRTWHTWSWQNISADQAWANILANHLAALR